MTKATSIAETGAAPGDMVKCVGLTDDGLNVMRYSIGKEYEVLNWFGRPMVNGNGHGSKCGAGDERWMLPFAGYGAEWELVS